jgi:outer membrane protein TolC
VSLGELAWWQVFEDEQLYELIHTALTENYDLRAAVARVLQARAQLIGPGRINSRSSTLTPTPFITGSRVNYRP